MYVVCTYICMHAMYVWVYHIIQWLGNLLSKELQSSDETALAGEMFYANTCDFDEIKFNTFNMSLCTPICCFKVL